MKWLRIYHVDSDKPWPRLELHSSANVGPCSTPPWISFSAMAKSVFSGRIGGLETVMWKFLRLTSSIFWIPKFKIAALWIKGSTSILRCVILLGVCPLGLWLNTYFAEYSPLALAFRIWQILLSGSGFSIKISLPAAYSAFFEGRTVWPLQEAI